MWLRGGRWPDHHHLPDLAPQLWRHGPADDPRATHCRAHHAAPHGADRRSQHPAPHPRPGDHAPRRDHATTAAGAAAITYVDEPATGALHLGHKGSRVQTMQGQLFSLGYQLGVDGYFGRGTEAAVRQFQQAQGLPADGVASPPTIERLAQVAPPG